MNRFFTFLLKSALLSATFVFLTGCPKQEDPVPAPIARFDYSPSTNLVAPVSITFRNLSTNATSYLWVTGGGQTSTDKEVTFNVAKGGVLTMSLTATGEGGTDTYTQTITVSDPVVVPPVQTSNPVADFTYSPSSNLTAPVTITFTNSSRNATSYLWEFGDGTTATSTSPSKQFTKAGDYAVKLTATDSKNQKAQKTATISVKAAAVTPVADWTWTASNLKVTFTNQSKNATSYSWNFGDGTSSTATNPVHDYSKAGVYTATLTASDGKTQHQDSKLVTVSAPVAATCDWSTWSKYVTVNYVYQYKTNGCSLNKFKDVTLITFKNLSNINVEFVMYIQRQDGSWFGKVWLWELKPGQEIKNWDDCGLAKQVIYWVRPVTIGDKCPFPAEPK